MAPDRHGPHLSTATLLDLLEERLAGARLRAAETHLGRPCPACRERLLELAGLTARMRADRMEEVPEALHRAALAAFAPGAVPAPEPEAGAWRRLVLAFDSLASPLAAGARRAVGEARRLRFELPGAGIELECEPESAGQCLLRGRLAMAEPELHRVEILAHGERRSAWADAGGAFLFEGVPRGACRLTVRGPEGRLETPEFET